MNSTLKKMSLMIFLGVASVSMSIFTSIAFGQALFQDGEYLRVGQQESNSGKRDKEAQQERAHSRERSDSNAGRNNARKGDSMSADERRALRQQIDEAGREIYKPRR